jgi:hemerythrin superfamily protein
MLDPVPHAQRWEALNMNALKLLQNDHRNVARLFARFERCRPGEREAVAARICAELTVHATIEEELLYPAAAEHLSDAKSKLVDHAHVEHATLKGLIHQIVQSDSSTRLYPALVKVLGEYVKHHVKEEEGEMFPALRKSDLDLDALGRELAVRKRELVAGGALPDIDDDADDEEDEEYVDDLADEDEDSVRLAADDELAAPRRSRSS